MRVVATIIIGSLIPGAVSAQALTDTEREALIASLTQTHEQLAELAESLSDEQWSFKPAEDRWSVAEVAEHVLLSEYGIMQIIAGPLMETPRGPEMSAAGARADQIWAGMLDRSQRFQAPQQATPTGQWPTREALIAAFSEARMNTLEAVENEKTDFHGHAFQHPVFGMADGHEWLVFLAAHCERHMLQIEEVMAHTSFPRAGTND